MEVTIGVLLFKDNTDGLLYVDEETPGSSGALLVVRQASCTSMPFILERGCFLGVVAMGEGLKQTFEIRYLKVRRSASRCLPRCMFALD